jgi:hypothetical protein
MTWQTLAAVLAATGIRVADPDIARVEVLVAALRADGERLTARVDPGAQPFTQIGQLGAAESPP